MCFGGLLLTILFIYIFGQMGGFLIKNEHLAKKDIQENVASLVARWSELLQASSNRGKGLGEARDILQFKEQVEKVERWMREKVSKRMIDVRVKCAVVMSDRIIRFVFVHLLNYWYACTLRNTEK